MYQGPDSLATAPSRAHTQHKTAGRRVSPLRRTEAEYETPVDNEHASSLRFAPLRSDVGGLPADRMLRPSDVNDRNHRGRQLKCRSLGLAPDP